MREVIPVRDINRRLPEQGRIRTGQQVATRNGKQRPDKLEHFRFTSKDEAAINEIAVKYGGTAQPWTGAPGSAKQWEVFTPLARIEVVLPPEPLGDGITYETWKGGGIERRCNGEMCEILADGPDGLEKVEVPCLCRSQNKITCKPKLHLTVILKDIPFGGGWRLTTSSEHAVRELPGMVDMILAMQDQQLLTSASLLLEQRTKVVGGKTQHFGVPMLALPDSLEAVMGGTATAIGAPAGDAPALGAAVIVEDATEAEVMIDDATIEAIMNLADQVITAWNDEYPEGPIATTQLTQALAAQVTRNPNQQLANVNQDHGDKILMLLSDIVGGTVEFRGIRSGQVRVKR